MGMKIFFILGLIIFILQDCCAQQLPYYTQYKSNHLMFNPAIAGTKKLIDARINYRKQWVNFDGAPVTQVLALHSRFLKGKLGAGGTIYKDETGPTRRMDFSLAGAYHIHFSDVELSLGIAGSMMQYTVEGSKITLRSQKDDAIDQTIQGKDWVPDASAGFYFYNDRFHIGLSILNLLAPDAEFYKKDDTKKGLVRMQPHYYSSFGYNYSVHPDYVFEHTLLLNYVPSAPLLLDYTLRLHIKEAFIAGLSYRLKDAIALHAGYTYQGKYQVSYSYDLITSGLHKYNAGTHEIMLVCSMNLPGSDKKGTFDIFQKQKYQHLF